MSLKSIFTKVAFVAAVVGVMAVAAMTPGAVKAFFVENPVRNLVNVVMQRQPVSPAGEVVAAESIQLVSKDQTTSTARQESSSDIASGSSITGTVELIGMIEAKSGSSWTVNGVTVVLTTTTEFQGVLNIGTQVKVEGFKQADGSILAREIKAFTTENGGFTGVKVEFTGTLTAKNGNIWTVDTTSVVLTTTTEVKGTLEVGVKVKVEGYKQADGSVLAQEIKPVEADETHHEENMGDKIEFEGILNAINGSTWTVDTTTVIISATTELKGNFEVGVQVKVEGYKQADGSVLAKEIKASGPKDEEHEAEGIHFEGVLTAMNGNTWTVDSITVLIDAKTQMEGTPQVGDTIRVAGQKLTDGTIVANNIKVSSGEDDKDGDDKGGEDKGGDDKSGNDDKGGGSHIGGDDKGGGNDKGGGGDHGGGDDKGHKGKGG